MKNYICALSVFLVLLCFCSCTQSDNSAVTGETDYMSWKYSDWTNAGENEKSGCAKAFAKEISEIRQLRPRPDGGDFGSTEKKLKEQIERILKSDPAASLGDTVKAAKASLKTP